jgi:hypothetical protein
MKNFPAPPKPRGWTTHVRNKGRRWLNEGDNRGKQRPKDLWTPYRTQLAAGFDDLCAYTLVYTANGTVDHFVPWSSVRGTRQAWRAYQWANLRHSAGWFNSARKNTPVPDPFIVQDDWFELLLPSLELVATDQVPPEWAAHVQNALRWLGRDPRVIGRRQVHFQDYQAGDVTLAWLDRRAPLISRALRANPEFLRDDDRP